MRPHSILADRRRIMLMCALTVTTTCYYLILNPSPRLTGQPATSNANVSPLLMRGRIPVPKGIRTCAEASALNGQAMILNGLTLKATYEDHSGA
ncbi:hypothetical protein FOXYSP1_08308 [Fusarium oxysporum f. sp. phaseoli]